MPDTWTLDTPDGPYTLNQSFAAPKYQPGSVSGPGALRRDDRTTYQRSGDGLRTPGALTLVGRVWRDDHNHALMVNELNAIRNAVTACTSVTRVNNAGTYTYDFVAGGATPEITPDGLGGWMVRLDLWPGRAEPTFVPSTPGIPAFVVAATATSDPAPSLTTGSILIPMGVQPGDLMLARIVARSTMSIPFAAVGVTTPGWAQTGSFSLIGGADFLAVKTCTSERPGDLIEWGLSNPSDGMRWHATFLAYRETAGAVTVVNQQRAFATVDGIAPSVDLPEAGLRLAFWACQIAWEYETDGFTAPPGVIPRVKSTNPEVGSGPYKFSVLATEDQVSEGATGVLTAQQEHGFTYGGATLWMPRQTVALRSVL